MKNLFICSQSDNNLNLVHLGFILLRGVFDACLSIRVHNLLAFGPPGVGKSHIAAAIGYELIQRGHRVLMCRTSDLVQRLQGARQNLSLAQEIHKLDKFDLLILDDLSYVQKDQAETSVLFELIASRYERKSLMITANRPFSGWDDVFPDKAMSIAAIDRLVHHATIFEMNVESYRRRAAYAAATSLSDIDTHQRQAPALPLHHPWRNCSRHPA